MRIAVIGAGGVGGGFGAALAKAGADVTFVARGAHLAAMRAKRPENRGGSGRDPHQASPGDRRSGLHRSGGFVLFCVKLWDVESAGAADPPLIGPDTAVIPLQNGIDAGDRLVPILGEKAVMGGTVVISATIRAPRRDPADRQIHADGVRRARRRCQRPRRASASRCVRAAGFDAMLSPSTSMCRSGKIHPADGDERLHRVDAPARRQAARRSGGILAVRKRDAWKPRRSARARGVTLAPGWWTRAIAQIKSCRRLVWHRWRWTCSAATGWNCPGSPARGWRWPRIRHPDPRQCHDLRRVEAVYQRHAGIGGADAGAP